MTSEERYQAAVVKFNELKRYADSIIYNKVYDNSRKKKEHLFNLRELNKHLFK